MNEKREYNFFIDDIIDSIQKIELYAHGLSFDDFEKNIEKQDAIIRRMEIIGEAVKNIPPNIRMQFPQIPWKQIAGLRDIITHNYSNLSSIRIWKIINQDIPELKTQMIYLKTSLN
ncbi:MAG TPA: DUF86 domain-containing protein [Cyclobacteriaceae bacterium]